MSSTQRNSNLLNAWETVFLISKHRPVPAGWLSSDSYVFRETDRHLEPSVDCLFRALTTDEEVPGARVALGNHAREVIMRNPLDQMRIRRQDIHNTYGMVRTRADGSAKPHQGWDLFAPVGTPIYAITNGLIRDVHEDVGGYGLQISLQFFSNGQLLYARYAHLSSVQCAEGENVFEGQLLGYTGTSGNASGMTGADQHLHFEIDTQLLPGLGLAGRIDPAVVLGYKYYSTAP